MWNYQEYQGQQHWYPVPTNFPGYSAPVNAQMMPLAGAVPLIHQVPQQLQQQPMLQQQMPQWAFDPWADSAAALRAGARTAQQGNANTQGALVEPPHQILWRNYAPTTNQQQQQQTGAQIAPDAAPSPGYGLSLIHI